jgi:hypothetical protein
MKFYPAIRSLTFLSAVFMVYATVCGAAQSKQQPASQVRPTTKPEAIYVADFAIDSAEVKKENGVLREGGLLGGNRMQRLNPLHRRENPEDTSRRLVNLLADSLTQDLRNYALPARRLLPGQPLPGKGWVVSGQFLEVDEGNRLRRAIIGFGQGATEMQIEVNVTNLSANPGTPFLTLGSTTGSGERPGAAVTLNPYVAAAKFVLSKNASEKDVVHAASNIAAEIVKYMNTRGLTR